MTTPRGPQRGAIAVLPVAAGGCSACAESVAALQATRYAATLRAQGISFVRSPRHADVVLISGTVTAAALDGLRAYLDAVPQPRALVAVGDCAIDGGVFAGASELVANPAEALDVNVEIAGCPPSPTAILAAITEAADLLAQAEAGEAGETDAEDMDAEDADSEEANEADATDEAEDADAASTDDASSGDIDTIEMSDDAAADQGEQADTEAATETGTARETKGHDEA